MDRYLHVVDDQKLPLVVLEFLQGGGQDYNEALETLKKNLLNCDEDGDIESDCNLPFESTAADLADILPVVNLNVDQAEAAVVQQAAEELRRIAGQFELEAVARATQSLQRRLKSSPSQEWVQHLGKEVENLIVRGVHLQDVPQERVIMAASLTLVKGVGERVPAMLQSLFQVTLQFIQRSGRR